VAETIAWIEINWFQVVQTVGIMCGLWFTAASFRQAAKAKEAKNILALSEQHRALWSEARQREELLRVFQAESIVLNSPITTAEEVFLNEVIVHYESGWQMAKAGTVLTLKSLAADIQGFFNLPLPRAVWEKTKKFRNPKFVRFVEDAMR